MLIEPEHIALCMLSSGLAQEPMVTTSDVSKHLDYRRVAPEGLFRRPRLYFVGEAPGAEESAQGKPFVGPAGRALREMLEEAGIDPKQVRLANAIPFRPIAYSKDRKPRNRSPTVEEVACYGAAVLADIRRSKPGMIIALGSTAARLFGESQSIQAARKARLQFESCRLRVTFHPAYSRRFGGRKGRIWRQAVADLRRAWEDSADLNHA
ncbi:MULTISPECIES: uracil-DNA glycosylase [unclassified Bradyrhizobium]|uniref:uracil-DNA glycosylase n=1 Tax=unclassified Bradyrhizobium TaxID=2631580 RepID=UPI002478E30F|nr:MULTISPECIES: uracil-DNA glycosylase [unclassified Bradyrhizobium]WGS21777.1 uracil-DNA glycosylase [Bradyrhizobium sp. ISRA463]WGS28727.1 uracil-DNA glycosylase [Bradyrhizobium sp. ISRA464]